MLSKLWTVRTLDGDRVGTYRRMTAKEAISQAVHDFAVTTSTFRRTPGLDPKKLTASVEPPMAW